MQNTMGFMGTPSLCTFGSPYICGGSEYRGVRESQRWSPMYPSFRRCFRDSVIFFSILRVGSRLMIRYLSASSRIRFIFCVYSSLSIITVALPLSAGTSTLISLEVLNCSSLLEGQVGSWGFGLL